MKIPFALGLSALALVASPLAAQDENVRDRSPDMRDVATTPISDLNLKRDEIPEVLLEAVDGAYVHQRLVTCDDLGGEIARLDAVLGPDLDIAQEDGELINVGKIAQSVVGSFIPFRSVIRRVSGAAAHEKRFQRAIYAGAVRRGFLKGLGEQRGCPYPARPAYTAIDISDADRVEIEETGIQEIDPTADKDGDDES